MSNNKVLKIIVVTQILILLLVISGVTDSYNVLRWDVLIVTITLALVCISSKRYYFGSIFIFFGILFNPIFTPSLSRIEWITADILLILLLLYWFWSYFNNYHKGLLFEKLIRSKFPQHEWVLVDHTKDLHKKINRFVESDSNPDFSFRKKSNGMMVAIECKYRSNYTNYGQWGLGIIWNKKQGDRYIDYSKQKNIPVYIAIGVGGNPKSPSIISFIPIEVIQSRYYKFIRKDIMERYQNIPFI